MTSLVRENEVAPSYSKEEVSNVGHMLGRVPATSKRLLCDNATLDEAGRNMASYKGVCHANVGRHLKRESIGE